MTKFSYSEYLSQLRHAGSKRTHGVSIAIADGRRRADADRFTTSECAESEDPVLLAIRSGDVKALSALALSVDHGLKRESPDGWTALHEAACCGETEAVTLILKAHPAMVDKRTLQEQTALLLAVSSGRLACVRSLLGAGADPDICGKSKDTPLYKACELENGDMVGLLVSSGATVNQRCAQGWTALHQAVSRDNAELCDALLRAGAALNPPNTYSITPLIVAAQQGRLRALRFLLGKGADVNMETCDGVTALHEASRHGHTEAVAALLERNADANKPCSSGLLPLHVAAQHGHQQIVILLVPVTSRARLRSCGVSPLHLAAQHNRPDAAAALLRTGADANAPLSRQRSSQHRDRRASPLYCAVAAGATETAELLLKAGASLTLDPVSPLLLAAQQGARGAVKLLLDHGADANASVPSWPTSFPCAVALRRGTRSAQVPAGPRRRRPGLLTLQVRPRPAPGPGLLGARGGGGARVSCPPAPLRRASSELLRCVIRRHDTVL